METRSAVSTAASLLYQGEWTPAAVESALSQLVQAGASSSTATAIPAAGKAGAKFLVKTSQPVRTGSGELCAHPVDDRWDSRPLTHVAAVKHTGRLGVAVVEAEVEVVDRVLLIVAPIDEEDGG